jgi:predicted metalloprotease
LGSSVRHKEYKIPLEPGDIESGINAANRIGDDTLMKEATGPAIPERYTHGASAQRMKWFTKGLKSGDINGRTELFAIPLRRSVKRGTVLLV